MAIKKWVVRDADKDLASELSEKLNIDSLVAFLLVSRGITDINDIVFFLGDSFVFTSPYDFVDMEQAYFTIGDAIDNGEKICIYGDYDCDGVTSTALLYSFLKSEGADVCYYIPDRESEGYGLNNNAISKIHNMGVNLIVTVDNGINSVDEAEYIYSLGMRLVVTDHHQLGSKLPRAQAVINPHRPENNLKFRDYCGVGVAFKLISAMYDGDVNDLVEKYIDLVAIGTIADVVPLVDENRAFVRAGIKSINKSVRPAIKAFVASSNKGSYSSNDVAFQLCPRINAMGRMGDAARAVEFLVSDDYDDCVFKYQQLNDENSHRQEIEKQILADIKANIINNPSLVQDRVIVLSGKNYHHGVIGIVASHVLDRYGKPAFIISVDDNGIARGSARSVNGFNVYEALDYCSDDLIQFGGHPLAAGVTLNADNIDTFRQHINAFAHSKYDVMPPQQLTIDCKLSPFYLSLDLVNNLSVLEPCGVGNPKAIFGIFNMDIVGVTPLSEGRHIKIEMERNHKRFYAVKFGTAFDDFPYHAGDKLNLAVKVSKNIYNQKTYLSIEAVDIRLSSLNDDLYFAQKDEYDKYLINKTVNPTMYPNREVCATVYKYLKQNNGYKYGVDNLYIRLQNSVTYSQLKFALKAFEQSGLINYGKNITVNDIENKVNLDDTPVLKNLKEMLNLD